MEYVDGIKCYDLVLNFVFYYCLNPHSNFGLNFVFQNQYSFDEFKKRAGGNHMLRSVTMELCVQM